MAQPLRILVAACAMTAAASFPALADSMGAYHIFPTPEFRSKTGHIPHPGAGEVEYFGGSVLSSGKVVSVIWGKKVAGQTVAQIGGFLNAIVDSTYVDQLSIYETHRKGVNGHAGTHQDIGRGSFLGQVQIKPTNKSLQLTDADIQTELAHQIAIGVLPASDLDTLYMIYFPSDVTITLDGLKSCRDFGAYHFASSTTVTNSNLFYGVMPDCGGGFVTLTIVSSHEYAEATTDNIPTPGSNPAYPQAWNTSDGYEIGDLCEGTRGALTAGANSYAVQQVYLNSTSACSTGNYTHP